MGVKINVSSLNRLADRQVKAAAKADAGAAAVVAKNAELLARIARAEAPVSDGSRDDDGRNPHLRDTIGWGMFGVAGTAAALIGPEGKYGEDIGSLVSFGTIKKNYPIEPRADGPGFIAFPQRGRVSPNPVTWASSRERYGGDGRVDKVIHPGFEGNDFMLRALAGVLPKFERDIRNLGNKSI